MASQKNTERRQAAPQGASSTSTSTTQLSIEQQAEDLAATIFQAVEGWTAQVDRLKRLAPDLPYDLARVLHTVNRLQKVTHFKPDAQSEAMAVSLTNAADEFAMFGDCFSQLAAQFEAVKGTKEHRETLCDLGNFTADNFAGMALSFESTAREAVKQRAGGAA